MPLVLEDGSGVADADTWVTEEDTTTYWTDRSVEEWIAAETATKEAKLREAADYLMIAYRYPGQPASLGQRLPWPRMGVPSGSGTFPADAIPAQIINAQMILAVEALSRPLLRKPAAAERQIIEETKAAKGLSKTIKYQAAPIDDVSGLQRFPVIDQILQGVASSGTGGTVGMVKMRKVL